MRKLIFCIICAALLAASGAYAYYTVTAFADNAFDAGSVTTQIVEEFPPPPPVDPGDVITKKVSIRNTGKDDCYVRVQVLFSDSSMEEICTLNYNRTDWVRQSDSSGEWWYYKAPLSPGSTTAPLFTSVSVSAGADAGSIVPFDIIVRQESRQSYGAASYAAAWG